MPSFLESSIIQAVVYFDLFYYPLTTLEIWQNLGCKASYGDVNKTLLKMEVLKFKNGMWCLRSSLRDGALSLSDRRAKSYRVSKHKLDKARKFARYLKWVPGLVGVYACNSLGYLNSQQDSDIDFFIITKPGRIWSARFFAILLAKLFGQRPSLNHTKDALCLSFFASASADMRKVSLNMRRSNLRSDGDWISTHDDIYFLFWMTKLFPLFVRNNAGEQFWARNRWVRKEFPQAEMICPPQCSSSTLSAVQRLAHHSVLFNAVEAVLRAVQMCLMPKNLRAMANKGTAVIVNNEFLKFHDHDQRADIKKRFQARLAEVLA